MVEIGFFRNGLISEQKLFSIRTNDSKEKFFDTLCQLIPCSICPTTSLVKILQRSNLSGVLSEK